MVSLFSLQLKTQNFLKDYNFILNFTLDHYRTTHRNLETNHQFNFEWTKDASRLAKILH